RLLNLTERGDLERFSSSCREAQDGSERTRQFLDRLLPHPNGIEAGDDTLESQLAQNGFDSIQHERIQRELRAGQIGLAKNRLPASIEIEDAHVEQVLDARGGIDRRYRQIGEEAIASGA